MNNTKGTPTLAIPTKKWTLMFFFASDNNLSPSMLSQIKAIKSAGYQQDTNVLLHFDPNEKGAPTRVFEVNRSYRLSKSPSRIGDADGPLVSSLTGDDITPALVRGKKEKEIDEMQANQALENFLTLCREKYPAKNYMLFLVGHGMIVGGDAFLPDDNPISAIGLPELERILSKFREQIRSHSGVLQLLGMHSCSMSGVEVAYQLQGNANYMLASQGISFIGAWPYRQMLIKTFSAIEDERKDGERKDTSKTVNVPELVVNLHELCIQHSADFMVGGYSADLCLCSLNPKNVSKLDQPIKNLGRALKAGLKDERCQHFILLAHWKSQSYWQETYTDLYDFCLCLRRLCVKQEQNRPLLDTSPKRPLRAYDAKQKALEKACQDVIDQLAPSQNGPIVRTDFVGAGTQYSHGLSVYFPWSEPVEDKHQRAFTNYRNYKFAKKPTVAWLRFLESYFKDTKRPSRIREDRTFKDQDVSYLNNSRFNKARTEVRAAFRIPGTPTGAASADTLDQKITPADAGGGGCICPSIKNYDRGFVMSPGASGVFAEPGQNPRSNKRAA